MNNMLRLEHLDRSAAEDAITKPLAVYNRTSSSARPPVSIEPALVTAILDDLQSQASDEIASGTDKLMLPEHPPGTIETPFLQMVLIRMWDEERAADSSTLRMQTYERLGRAANIARTHLDTMMDRLSEAERDVAANILRFMVTPSGSKIAQEAGSLALWTELPEAQVTPILNRLSSAELRILRTIQTPGRPLLYELFHDVLAQAVLNWRRRYVAAQQAEKIRREEQIRLAEEREEAERQRERERSRFMRRALIAVSALFVLTLAMLSFALWQAHRANQAKQQEIEADELAETRRQAAEKLKDDQAQSALHSRDGYVFLKKGKFAEAAYEYGEAVKLDPKDATLYNSQGYALMRDGRLAESISVLQQAVAFDSNDIWGHYNLGLAYHKNGSNDDAVKECLKVLELDKSFCDTFKKDVNYQWFTCSNEFQTNCGSRVCKVTATRADTAAP
jgi:tetratricopeptide (TPR) repeat protein